ncbi:MAG: tyrosine-type recombinase/integrase [Nitrososphaeraceae archaeon]
MPSTSKAINQYIQAVSDSNKRTGYEYLKRLEHFEKFVKQNYHFNIDELTIDKVFNCQNIYDLLSSYVSYLVNRTNDSGHNISNLTVKQRLITAKNFLEYYDIEISPRRFKVKVKIPKIVKRHKEALTKEYITKILETCSNSTKLKAYTLFLAATGCRASEACSVRLTDIDFEKHKVLIRGEFTKTRTDRYVLLTEELAEELMLWLDYKYRIRRRYSRTEHRNIHAAPDRKNTDLVFASCFNNTSSKQTKTKDEYKIIQRLYVTLAVQFDKILDQLKIGYEDSTRRRRKFTLHSFRRFVKSTISDLGYSDYSEWYIGHSGSTYYRKSDKDKFELFKKIEPYLTFLDQSSLERRGADLQNRLDLMERENTELKGRYEQDMKSVREEMDHQFSKIMSLIQKNPKLAHIKPEVLADRKLKNK